jgi:hypothetical protein
MGSFGVGTTLSAALVMCWLAAPSAPAFAASQCPNEKLRVENKSVQLPDCRAYEQVTLAGPYDAEFNAVAPGANTVFFASSGAIAGLPPDANGGNSSVRMFGVSRTDGGWSLSALTNFTGELSHTYQFIGSSADGSRMFVTSTTRESPENVYPEVRALNLYETANGGPPLLISHDEHGNEITETASGGLVGPVVVSADGTHVVFSSGSPLTARADSSSAGPFLYESDAYGNVSLVSAMSDGELPPSGTGVGLGSAKSGETEGLATVTNAVSTDGSTVFFTSSDQYDPSAPANSGGQIFMHRNGSTTDVSKGTSGALFDGASIDATKVVSSDEQRNIYEFDSATNAVVPISSGAGGLNTFLTMSADGSHVYFASNLQLDPAGPPVDPANPFQPFLFESVNGHVTYIATLSEEDLRRLTFATATGPPEIGADDRPGTRALGPIRATPSGSQLVFDSEQRLTADDHNREAGRINVYEYTDGRGLVRVSQGSLPGSGNGPGSATIGSWQQPPDFAPAATAAVQENTPFTFGVGQTDGRVIAEDGSVFFSSREALAEGATTGPLHVYEWKGGKTYLISPAGPEATDAHYLDNSPDGANVYFSTTEEVLPSDANGGWVNVWDARVNGGFPGTSAANPCAQNECPVSSPVARGAPASMTFAGAGNAIPSLPEPPTPSSASARPKSLTLAQKLLTALRHCRAKRNRHARAACEGRARKRYAAQSKTTRHQRRAT